MGNKKTHGREEIQKELIVRERERERGEGEGEGGGGSVLVCVRACTRACVRAHVGRGSVQG